MNNYSNWKYSKTIAKFKDSSANFHNSNSSENSVTYKGGIRNPNCYTCRVKYFKDHVCTSKDKKFALHLMEKDSEW